MEPMTLGSAPSSPASPGINPNFLPSFLMGEAQPTTPNLSTSPGRARNSGNFPGKLGMSVTDRRNLRHHETPTPTSPFQPISEKGGPPKQGLFDELDHKKKPSTPIMSSTMTQFNESAVFNESLSRIHDDSLNYSRVSDTFSRTNVNNRIDSSWVTVFGFPPSALSLVLSQLASCGPIVDKKVPTQGNWAHVKFNNRTEVCKALALNGKCINNVIMIGVTLYHDKDNKENDSSAYGAMPMRARSLRHSFISPQSANNNTVLSPQALPQKSTGLVTKAMEYVFGW